MIARQIEKRIRADFGKGKAVMILGPRRTGKTTLLGQLTAGLKSVLNFNCDDSRDRQDLACDGIADLKALVGNAQVVTIDEAQRLPSPGLVIKMLVDALGEKTQFIVTGSSSLELAGGVYESAVGRTFEYQLPPLAFRELADHFSEREETQRLAHRLVYGAYPEVVLFPDEGKRVLQGLVEGSLYKDVLAFEGLRKPFALQRLVQCLALQIGSEVSYNELSGMVGLDRQTIETYIDILEKSFVVFRLPSLSRNARNEIRKSRKVYFWDNGVRNAVIGNFSPLELRSDTGALWENYLVAERRKRLAYEGSYARSYFWRTTAQSEIDYLEEADGHIEAWEIKWNPRRKARTGVPSPFKAAYPDSGFQVVTPENYQKFI